MKLHNLFKNLMITSVISSTALTTLAVPCSSTLAADSGSADVMGGGIDELNNNAAVFEDTDFPDEVNAETVTVTPKNDEATESVDSDSAYTDDSSSATKTEKEILHENDSPEDNSVTSGVGAKKTEVVTTPAKSEDNNKEQKKTTTSADKKAEEKITGWRNTNGKWFYYKDGIFYTGWHYMAATEGEKTPHWSFFGKDGVLRTGWTWLTSADGEKTPHWSYFGINGWLRTGWVRLGKGTAEPDSNSTPHWSYFGNNGWLRTGWVRLGKGTAEPDGNSTPHWSYFGENGWLRTGWAQLGKGTSNPDGNAAKHWSYFGDNGWLKTGWFKESEGIQGLRYFDNSGWLLGAYGHKTGWQKIGRVYYRFDEIGRINGANMPEYNIYDQIEYVFRGACGPSAAFHAANATGGLLGYKDNPDGYKRFVWDIYGMPYYTNDNNAKGVYTTGTSLVNISAFLKKKGVEAVYSPYRQYTTEEVKEAITHGQAVVPLIFVWYVGSKSSYFSQHYVAVTGWKQEGSSLQFYTADSYKNKNTGWTDVNKDGNKVSAYGYNKYTGYNPTVGRAPRPGNGVGYSMKVGTYINLP